MTDETSLMVWRMTPDDGPEFSAAAPAELQPGDTYTHPDGRSWTVLTRDIQIGVLGTAGFATLTSGATK